MYVQGFNIIVKQNCKGRLPYKITSILYTDGQTHGRTRGQKDRQADLSITPKAFVLREYD